MTTDSYLVDWVDLPGADDMPVRCGSCLWRGRADQVDDVESCALQAGDPSPAGRCPVEDCGALVYPDDAASRATEWGLELWAALELARPFVAYAHGLQRAQMPAGDLAACDLAMAAVNAVLGRVRGSDAPRPEDMAAAVGAVLERPAEAAAGGAS